MLFLWQKSVFREINDRVDTCDIRGLTKMLRGLEHDFAVTSCMIRTFMYFGTIGYVMLLHYESAWMETTILWIIPVQ